MRGVAEASSGPLPMGFAPRPRRVASDVMVEVLAVVPARGGSKGLPKKNLRELTGRTLVARAVEAAIESLLVTRVVGSTDDEEVAAELIRAGAEVVARPVELGGDEVPDPPVFLHVLETMAVSGYRPEIVVNVRPTAPLRLGSDVDAVVQLLLDHPEALSVKSVSPVSEHPYKMWLLDEGAVLQPLLPEWRDRFGGDPDVARQLLPVVYRSNGAVDAVRAEALLASRRFHPGPVLGYVTPAERSIDIDDERDLALAASYLEVNPA